VHLGRVGDFPLNDRRSWESPRLLGVYYTEEGIEEACINCYKESHAALQFGQDVHRDLQTYAVGQKDRSIDKYMRWFHDPSFKIWKTPIPGTQMRNRDPLCDFFLVLKDDQETRFCKWGKVQAPSPRRG
jgi:hypothetical protein